MKKVLLKSLSIFLILTHLFTFCLRDLSFAEQESPAADTSVGSDTTSTTSSTASSASESSSSQGEQSPPEITHRSNFRTDFMSAPMSLSAGTGLNLAVLQSFQNDPFTGRATFSIPIEVLPGRRGIQPNIAITYGSGGNNGIAGVGWNLDLGSIERSTKKGTPSYDSSDVFVFNSGGSTIELVSIGDSQYRPKQEGAFMRFVFDGNKWVVTDKSGTKFYFGQSEASQQQEAGRIFKWCLDKVMDTFGNYLSITYIKDENQVYPNVIEYTSNDEQKMPASANVEFIYADREDVLLSNRAGFRIATAKLLSDIRVNHKKDRLLRRYHFEYTKSTSNRSILNSVTQYGSDDRTSLPPITFEYQKREAGPWQVVTEFTLPGDINIIENTEFSDVNNDGYQDIIKPGATYLSDGKNNWVKTDKWIFPANMVPGPGNPTRVVDLNADGWVDAIFFVRNREGDNDIRIHLNNKVDAWVPAPAGFKFPTTCPFAIGRDDGYHTWTEFQGVTFADVNGDGRQDIINASIPQGQWGQPEIREVYLYDDATQSWVEAPSFRLPQGTLNGAQLIQFGDLNADGLNDYLVAGEDGYHAAYINKGRRNNTVSDAWEKDENFTPPSDVNFGDGTSALADVNGDGLADIVIASDGTKKTYLNKGNGKKDNWREDKKFELPITKLRDEGVRFLSANGKFQLDMLQVKDGRRTFFRNESEPENLIKVSNGIGGELSITYKTSTEFSNTGQDNIPDLPFPLEVIDTVTVHDSVNQANPDMVTRYEYKDGFYDFKEKEFRGFKYVKVANSEGSYSETYFKQDEIYKGRPYLQETKDKDGNLFSKSENTWLHSEPYPGVYFVYLSQADAYVYDGDATFKHTAVKTEYDTYGNPTKVISAGEVEQEGDEKTQVTEYTYNPQDWIVAIPNHTYLLDSQGNKAAQKWFYYDGSTSLTTPPSKGLLTQEESWLYNPLTKTEQRVASSYTYNPFGNLTSSQDALGRTVTTEYDNVSNIYPIRVTNHKGHTVRSAYYGINEGEADEIKGNGIPGQPKYTEDANGKKSHNIYDTLGRMVKVIGPLDNEGHPGITYAYDLSTTPVKVARSIKVDYGPKSEYYTVYAYYDGLGRLIENKLPAEDDPQTKTARQIISGIAKYDTRGQVTENYLPYYVEASDKYVEPDYKTAHSTVTYDAMGRVIKTTNPDGTSAQATYSDWSRTTTDENGHSRTEHNDAYGRIITVEEHNGNQVYNTKYAYDVLGNLNKLIDNQGNTTNIIYDSLSRKLQMDDPDMGIWNYDYDLVGNLKTQTDAKGQTLSFEYDDLNRLLRKTGTVPAKSPTESDKGTVPVVLATYIYDDPKKPNSIGRLSKVIDQSGSIEFSYDQLGREIESVKEVDGASYKVTRGYDALDRLLILKYPDDTIIRYHYNPQGIDSVDEYFSKGKGLSAKGVRPYVSNIDYSATSQISKIQYGNGTETNYAYDPNTLRLTSLVTSLPKGIIQDFTYDFDKIGNIKSIQDKINNANQQFLYDDLDRLIQAQGPYGSFSYDYDSIGNMLNKEGATLTYGKEGKLPHAVTSYTLNALRYTLDYDANGNMISKQREGDAVVASPQAGSSNKKRRRDSIQPAPTLLNEVENLTYTYDLENRLIRVENGDTITSFAYDGDGGRVQKTLQRNNAITQVTTYIGSLFEIAKQEGQKEKTNAVVKYIFAGSQRICALTETTLHKEVVVESEPEPELQIKPPSDKQPLTWAGLKNQPLSKAPARPNKPPQVKIETTTTQTTHYYHPDHLGSSNVITDEKGEQVSYTEFTPYGSTFKQTGTADVKHKFTGKELDSSTGLYFYGARYYDPEIGRFITPDTIVQAPYDPQSLNRYSYCRNNPINLVDPTGHSWKSFWKKVGDWFSDFGKAITQNPGAFIGALLGGIAFGFLGSWVATSFLAPAFATGGITAMESAFITGVEFGIGGFGSGFVGTLAGGGQIGDAFKNGGIGFGTGFILGGVVGYTYASGMQDFIHGFNAREYNNYLANNGQGYGKLYLNAHDTGGSTGVGNDWGHSWITLEDNAGNQMSHGWWPDGGANVSNKEWVLGKQIPGRMTARPGLNDLVKPSASHSWNITKAQFDQVIRFKDAYAAKMMWSLSTNCTHFAVGATRAAGISVPLRTTFPVSDPNILARWLKSLKE